MTTTLPALNDTQEFDYSVDLLRAILWQYNSATKLQSLLQSKQSWYDTNQTQFWEDWYTDVFNLATANDFGLSVWSIILNQPIYINNAQGAPNNQTFGIGVNNQNLTNGNLQGNSSAVFYFSTPIARLLLQLRYFQLTSSGTVPEINRMLKYLFSGYGLVYLVDDLDMTQRYLFYFTIPSEMRLMLTSFDILPRPAGVKSTIEEQYIMPFGIGIYRANLTNGNLFDGEF